MKMKKLCLLFSLVAINLGMTAQQIGTPTSQQRNRETVALPYSYGFEEETEFGKWSTYSLDCWDLSIRYEDDGTYTTNAGSYGFKFYTNLEDCDEGDHAQYLISPEISGTSEVALKVEFYYKNFDEEASEVFQVGYSISGNAIDDFVWDDQIIADGNDWVLYQESFPVGVKYIAVSVMPGGNTLLLDDFSFSEYEGLIRPVIDEAVVNVNTVSLAWTGGNDSYELRYGKSYTYDFEDGMDWTSIDADGDEYGWTWSDNDGWLHGHNSDNMVYSMSADDDGNELDPNNYLVSPIVPLGGKISFYARGNDGFSYDEHFGVFVCTNQNLDLNNFNENDFTKVKEFDALNRWMEYTVDLDQYNGMGYVAIRHFNSSDRYYLSIDDITITGRETIISNINDSRYTLESLEPGTYYVQVKGLNNRFNDWSPKVYFTISEYEKFVTDGNWNVGSNWKSGSVPAAGNAVVIAANATIPAQYTANANGVAIQPGGSIFVSGTLIVADAMTNGDPARFVVLDGGQYYGNPVQATVHKAIVACNYSIDNNTGYTLIATPMASTEYDNTNHTNLATDNYDLYSYLPNPNDGLEWRNFKDNDNEFTELYANQGYLYANGSVTDLVFMGQLNEDVDISLAYEAGESLKSLSLVGNSFAHNQTFYVYDMEGQPQTTNFLTINSTGDGFNTVSGTSFNAAPMQGFFVQADGEAWNLSTEATEAVANKPTESDGMLNIMVSRNRGASVIDNAIVSFGKAPLMNKFRLSDNATELYITEGAKDYAVVNAVAQGELPVSFKAAENGSYTLTVEIVNVELDYLHLIDNMTGADVDLLENPEYTFEARTTDYASRFRLVFANNENDSSIGLTNFASNNGSNWVINNLGEATLQVVDVMGRVINSESISGNATVSLNQPAGVYMLRLVSGNDVKVQKVVVR